MIAKVFKNIRFLSVYVCGFEWRYVCPCVRYLRIFLSPLFAHPIFLTCVTPLRLMKSGNETFVLNKLSCSYFLFWGCVCLSVCRRACCLFACLPLVHHQAFQLPPRTVYIIKHHRLRIRSVRHQIASVQTPRQLGLFFRYSFIFAFRFQAACLIMRSD